MTLAEAEVNQPSQPPLSIFSLGGKALSFTAAAMHRGCSYTAAENQQPPILIGSSSLCSQTRSLSDGL